MAPSIASSETLAPSTLDLPTVFTATAKHHACQMPAYEQWVSLATTTPWRRTEERPNRLMSFPLSQTTILSRKKHWKLPWCCMSLSERLACRQTKSPNGPVSQEFALVRMLAQSTLKTKLLSSTRHAMSVFHKRKKCPLQSSTGSNFSMRQLETDSF